MNMQQQWNAEEKENVENYRVPPTSSASAAGVRPRVVLQELLPGQGMPSDHDLIVGMPHALPRLNRSGGSLPLGWRRRSLYSSGAASPGRGCSRGVGGPLQWEQGRPVLGVHQQDPVMGRAIGLGIQGRQGIEEGEKAIAAGRPPRNLSRPR